MTDAEEYTVEYANRLRTDPCNRDTDGDGLPDGLEVGRTRTVSLTCGANFVADATPSTKTNPTAGDTDGDGISDGVEDTNRDGRREPTETDPVKRDSDCDGYSDGQELMMAAGCATSGTDRDTDGDGIPDGVEGGLQPVGADPVACSYTSATYDSDTTMRTNACVADTDHDGILDGAEDANLNGRADPGELNPNNPADATGVAQHACATTNLRGVTFHSSPASDVQLALSPDFSEVSRLLRVTLTSVQEAGYQFYDPSSRIGGIAISKVPAGSDATAEEADARGRIGGVSGQLTQTITTWDGFGGSVLATYDVSSIDDLKVLLNRITQNYLGMNALGLFSGSAGVGGPFKVVAEFVRRSPTRAVVILALIPANLYTGQSVFKLNDAAGGSTLAQFGDFANTQCEVFAATVNQKVDFLWVVDDSCSMSSSQRAVASAGNLFGQKLSNAGLDWRAAGVSTGWYSPAYEGSVRDWTNSLATMQSWFAGGTGSFGTSGSGTEQGFAGAQTFINRWGNPVAGPFRSDAQAHLIFLTDTAEQSPITAAGMQTFLSQRLTRPIAHGILCPEGSACGDISETTPGKYHAIIRATGGVIGNIQVFNPAAPSAQERAQQEATIDAILSAAIGSTGTQLQRPPISSTIKVAVGGTRGVCNANDVPRDRSNGWDIDPATRRIIFVGNCIPSGPGVPIAISYKYWNDLSPDINGDACGGTCAAPLSCDPLQRACVCSTKCGGCPTGFSCDLTTCTCGP